MALQKLTMGIPREVRGCLDSSKLQSLWTPVKHHALTQAAKGDICSHIFILKIRGASLQPSRYRVCHGEDVFSCVFRSFLQPQPQSCRRHSENMDSRGLWTPVKHHALTQALVLIDGVLAENKALKSEQGKLLARLRLVEAIRLCVLSLVPVHVTSPGATEEPLPPGAVAPAAEIVFAPLPQDQHSELPSSHLPVEAVAAPNLEPQWVHEVGEGGAGYGPIDRVDAVPEPTGCGPVSSASVPIPGAG
eukprot:s2334_g10.t3